MPEQTRALKPRNLTKKETKAIHKVVKEATILAEEDTGLDPKNYGMLEERIRWYIAEAQFSLGYRLEIKLHRDSYLVEVTAVYYLTTEEIEEGEYVLRNPRSWRLPEMY